jgi:5'-nucleotidase
MLNIAISSKLILDMTVPCQIFDNLGKQAFEQHMAENINKPLPEGPMVPLIRALQETGLVNFFVVSKIGPESGKRITQSLQFHGINIPADNLIYLDKYEAYTHAKTLNVHAYLSCNAEDVTNALKDGIPAAYLMPISYSRKPIPNEIKIALDFDGIIAADDSDVFAYAAFAANTASIALDLIRAHEFANQNNILKPGPFAPFAKALSDVRKILSERDGRKLRLEVVTARCEAQCGPRAKNTLKALGIEVDNIEFRDGKSKGEYIATVGAHLFFDDTVKHIHSVSSEGILSAHAPHGVANTNFVAAPSTARTYFVRRSPWTTPRLDPIQDQEPLPPLDLAAPSSPRLE